MDGLLMALIVTLVGSTMAQSISKGKFCQSFLGSDVFNELQLDKHCAAYVVRTGTNLCLADPLDMDGPGIPWTCKPAVQFLKR